MYIHQLSSVSIAALAVQQGVKRMSKGIRHMSKKCTLKICFMGSEDLKSLKKCQQRRQKPTTGANDEVLMRAMYLSFTLCSLEKAC